MPSKKVSKKGNHKDYTFKQIHSLTKDITTSNDAVIVEFADCFLERIFISSIEDKYKKVYANDLTPEWIEDELFSFGLFGSEGPYLCLLSENLNSRVRDKIKEKYLNDESEPVSQIVFVTSQKINDKFLNHEFPFINVTGPKFWEMSEYFDVLSESLGIRLSLDAKEHLLNSLSPDGESYYAALMVLKSYPKDQLTLALVRKLFKPKRIDNFMLADYFNQKNLKKIFHQLLLIENDFDSYREFFSFMQGHVLKILDNNYFKDKPSRLNKYDQGISRATTKWTKDELLEILERFGKWEILCKSRSDKFRDELRLKYLNS